MQQLSPMDAAFLYLENDSTHAHGTLVWIYDAAGCEPDAINRRALLEHMRTRLQVSPVFTRKIHRLPLDFDYPYWVDDKGFELLYHVREASLSEGSQWADFCRLVAQVHSRPLDHDHLASANPELRHPELEPGPRSLPVLHQVPAQIDRRLGRHLGQGVQGDGGDGFAL